MPNPYTGTDNDPIMQAQHQQLGSDWEKYFKLLNAQLGGRLPRMGAQGPGAPVYLGGPTLGSSRRLGDDDVARTNTVNDYLGQLADENKLKAQADRDMAAHNQAVDAQSAGRQAAERGLAIANDPGTSAFGAPIVGGNGSYQTGAPVGQPPVNRQAIAAQMAPGQIAPPAPAPPVTYGKPEPAMVNGKRVYVRAGSDGMTYGMDRRPVDPTTLEPPPDKSTSTANPDVADAVAGMVAGTLPPQMPGRASKDYTAILAEAKRQGYDLSKAATDWSATQKHVATMNGAQQLRLNQAINALPDMLDSVDSLAQQWKGGKFPLLNKASLALAKGGALGPEAATIANQLDAQIADVTADLGNVYMGGNSPTDHALQLAGKSLKGEWDETVLRDMVKLAKQNVQIRRNSIANTGVAGASADNPYGNQGAAAPPAPAGFVDMVTPSGEPLHVPAGDVAKALAAGAKRKGG